MSNISNFDNFEDSRLTSESVIIDENETEKFLCWNIPKDNVRNAEIMVGAGAGIAIVGGALALCGFSPFTILKAGLKLLE